MKQKISIRIASALSAAAVLCVLLLPSAASAQETVPTPKPVPEKYRQAVAAFEERANGYATRREALEQKLPKLARESTPEDIEAHKNIFQDAVRADRAGAKQGDIFVDEVAAHIRALIKSDFKGNDLVELRKAMMEADTKGVPLRVNYPYPEAKEMAEMPPTLLLNLPQLPKQLRYRFVTRHLLLVDRENGLIVDYMTDALPPGGQAEERAHGKEGTPAAAKVAAVADPSVKLTLPSKEGSLRFMVVGDTGTGTEQQQQLADMMYRYKQFFPYEFALMLGDNMYGAETAADFKNKFENIYKKLLDDKVMFYATLGNHDESNQRFYDLFNMKGEEYYRLGKGNVSFYSLNSNYMEKKQIKWLEDELAKDTAEWKVAFFHHPPYSSGGKHGSSSGLRDIVEPIFLKYGVNVVLAGHEHFYERVKPQKGIYYFISGAGGKLRPGDVKKGSPLTEKAYDKDMSFMLFEVVKDEMHFQVISRTGETVDSGVLMNQRKKAATATQ